MQVREKSPYKIISIAVGIVYYVFGALKFFPSFSPAEDLASTTIQMLTFHLLPSHLGLILLAVLETFIGLSLLLNTRNKFILYLAIAHIVMTFSPIFLIPEEIFGKNEFNITLAGQYIFKNIIILAALFALKQESELIHSKANRKKGIKIIYKLKY